MRISDWSADVCSSDLVVPVESAPRWGSHGPTDELRDDLTALARAAGLLSPHVGERWGGLGLSHVGRALGFEEAGWSMIGPVALGIAAPDEGNAHLLEHVATYNQSEPWPGPLAGARTPPAFALPPPT